MSTSHFSVSFLRTECQRPLWESGLWLRWDLPSFWKVSCLPCSLLRFQGSHRTYKENEYDVVVQPLKGYKHLYRPKWGCVGPRSQARLYISIFFSCKTPWFIYKPPNPSFPILKLLAWGNHPQHIAFEETLPQTCLVYGMEYYNIIYKTVKTKQQPKIPAPKNYSECLGTRRNDSTAPSPARSICLLSFPPRIVKCAEKGSHISRGEGGQLSATFSTVPLQLRPPIPLPPNHLSADRTDWCGTKWHIPFH